MNKSVNLPPDVILEADELAKTEELWDKLAELIFACASNTTHKPS